ncbi:MAG TPA: hypothetical protein VIM19_16610 [Actinomycetes bacterium]
MTRRNVALLGAAGLLLAGCSTAHATVDASGIPPTTPSASAATGTATTPASTTASPAPPSAGPSTSRSAVTQMTARPTASTSAQATVIEVRLAKGAVTPPTDRAKVPLGSRVVIRFTSDISDTVHVHGSDIEQAVRAGTTKDIAFVADLQGTFEVETHDSTMVLMQLQVS